MKKTVTTILIIVFAIVFLGSGSYLFYKLYWEPKQTGDEIQELIEIADQSETEPDDGEELKTDKGKKILKRYKKLYKKNNDMIGWVKVKNTPIDYPVMQTPKDNEFYLHRNFKKNDDVNGLPFLDAKCDPEDPYNNLLVYGHHMKSGMMFKHLMDYETKDFYKKHKIIQFDTLYDRREYEVVAAFYSKVYKEDQDVFKYYEYKGPLTEKKYNKFIQKITKMTHDSGHATHALYDTGVKPKYGEQLLTLVTCAYHVDEGRFVVVARRVG